MRTTLRPAVDGEDGQIWAAMIYEETLTIPDLSIEIFSAEFVLGPITRSSISTHTQAKASSTGYVPMVPMIEVRR